MKASVDKSLCVGNLWCVRNLPAVFHTDEHGRAEVSALDGVSEDQIVDVAFGCPVAAISVADAETGEDLLV
jgi:ferredoxin